MTRREEGVAPVPSFPSRTTDREPARSPCFDTNPPNPPKSRLRAGSEANSARLMEGARPAEKTSKRRGSGRQCVVVAILGPVPGSSPSFSQALEARPGNSEIFRRTGAPSNPAHDPSIATSLPLFPALPSFQRLATVSPGYVVHRFLLRSCWISMPSRNAFFLGGHARKVIERWRLVKKRR